MQRVFRYLPLVLAVAMLAVGCGKAKPKRYKVTGQVTNAGRPITVRPVLDRVQVRFMPLGGGATIADTYEANVDPATGSFDVPGPESKGIPAGRYKIVVHQWVPFPDKDLLKDRFSEANSKIEREVPEGGAEINIDVSKPTG